MHNCVHIGLHHELSSLYLLPLFLLLVLYPCLTEFLLVSSRFAPTSFSSSLTTHSSSLLCWTSNLCPVLLPSPIEESGLHALWGKAAHLKWLNSPKKKAQNAANNSKYCTVWTIQFSKVYFPPVKHLKYIVPQENGLID